MSGLVNEIRILVGSLAVLAATPAFAQSGQNQTAAQALYDEGRRLMEAKDYADACPKFKESYDLDPGGGTLLNLADCYEKDGKPALAWTTFKEALVMAQRDSNQARIEFAKTHIGALDPTLSYVTINVPSEVRVDGLNVTIDGTPLGAPAWGVAVPVDPGAHQVRAEAPSRKPFMQAITIPTEGGHHEVVGVPLLEPAVSGASGGAGTDHASSGGFLNGRNVGWISTGVGVVGLGVGTYFGLKAFSDWDERNKNCKPVCTVAAKDAGDRASTAATVSTVALAVGAGAVAVGVVLILTSGKSDAHAARATTLEASVAPTPGGALIGMRHRW